MLEAIMKIMGPCIYIRQHVTKCCGLLFLFWNWPNALFNVSMLNTWCAQ